MARSKKLVQVTREGSSSTEGPQRRGWPLTIAGWALVAIAALGSIVIFTRGYAYTSTFVLITILNVVSLVAVGVWLVIWGKRLRHRNG